MAAITDTMLMTNPETGHTVTVVRSAFETVWQHKGFVEAEDGAVETPRSADGDGDNPNADIIRGNAEVAAKLVRKVDDVETVPDASAAQALLDAQNAEKEAEKAKAKEKADAARARERASS